MAGNPNGFSNLVCKLNPVKDITASNIALIQSQAGSDILIASGAHSEVNILSSERHLVSKVVSDIL